MSGTVEPRDAHVPTATLRGAQREHTCQGHFTDHLCDFGVPIRDGGGHDIDPREELRRHWRLIGKQPAWHAFMIGQSTRRDLPYPMRALAGEVDVSCPSRWWMFVYGPIASTFFFGALLLAIELWVIYGLDWSGSTRNAVLIACPIFYALIAIGYLRVATGYFVSIARWCEKYTPHFHGVLEATWYSSTLLGKLDGFLRFIGLALSNVFILATLVSTELQFQLLATGASVVFYTIPLLGMILMNKDRLLAEFYITELIQQCDIVFGMPEDKCCCCWRTMDPEKWLGERDREDPAGPSAVQVTRTV